MAAAETIQNASSAPQTEGAPVRYAQALLGLADDRRQADPAALEGERACGEAVYRLADAVVGAGRSEAKRRPG